MLSSSTSGNKLFISFSTSKLVKKVYLLLLRCYTSFEVSKELLASKKGHFWVKYIMTAMLLHVFMNRTGKVHIMNTSRKLV